MKEMLLNLTGLRFYASLWVFLYHAIIYVNELDCLFLQHGYIGVDFFFILSGFILTYVYYDSFFVREITSRKYWNFVVKRFAKIYPMHFISFIMVAIMLYAGKYVFHQDLKLSPELIPSILLMVHSWGFNDEHGWNVPSWSISSEWFAYLFLFVPFAFVFKQSKKIFSLLVILVVVFFLFKWSNTTDFSLDNPEKLTNFGLERLFPEFIFGMLLGYFRIELKVSKIISTIVFLISFLSFLLLMYGGLGLNPDAFCIIPLAGIIFSLSYKTYLDFFFDNKFFIYLGNVSFTFYILQLIPFFICKIPFEWLNAKGIPPYPLAIFKTISLIGANLLLASFFYKYYEEPMRKLIVKKLSKK